MGHRFLISKLWIFCHGALWVHYVKVTVLGTFPLPPFFNSFGLYLFTTKDWLKKEKHFQFFSVKLGTCIVLNFYLVSVLKMSMFAKQLNVLASWMT